MRNEELRVKSEEYINRLSDYIKHVYLSKRKFFNNAERQLVGETAKGAFYGAYVG